MEAAAKSNLKPVSLELGGKCPVVIFNDADVDMAVDLACNAIFYNKALLSLQHTHILARLHNRMRTRICTRTCTYVYVLICTYICTYMRVHTHIHMCTYTYRDIYIYVLHIYT